MSRRRGLSNPFSTGGGGSHFEAHVQACFVTLMLSGGYAPCLPCWPITEVKLQGKIDGFDTDDLVVFVEDPISKERRKLLGQVKHSVAITQSSTPFREFIQAAWNDFNTPRLFTRDKDVLALITGPLSATDARNVPWLLNQARHTKNFEEFLRNVRQAKFSPPKAPAKLDVFKRQLAAANGGNEVTRDELYDFLNHLQLLGYDLGGEFGVVQSLLHSHISQFQRQYPQWVWSRIVDTVQTWNQDAGTITVSRLPEDLVEAFKPKVLAEMPKEFKAPQEGAIADWENHADATYLALVALIGAWSEKNQSDLDALAQLLGISYDEWLTKAREILHVPDSPLSLKDGIWKVANRIELLNLLGSRILDQNLSMVRSLSVSTLKERDPAFDLPPEERYAAVVHGKILKCSATLRAGVAEGLAILGNNPDAFSNCSQGEVEKTTTFAMREILLDADWVLWGSLNRLLPTLAEAAPDVFLDAVEKALMMMPCPFDELFAQEGNGIAGKNYLTGLLWALEGLAWDEQYLVRVCVALGELASHDPGGQWANRPSNSLATILLPWLPQTLAPAEKRRVAINTLLKEQPDIAWNLIIRLLPGQHQTSDGSHTPNWRMSIIDGLNTFVSNQEYWEDACFFAELAVEAAGQDAIRLARLIDHFHNLPQPAFNQLIEVLSSPSVSAFSVEHQQLLWDHLMRLITRHRKFPDAKRSLGEDLIAKIEQVAEQIAPTNPFDRYQHLFTDRDIDLYEQQGNWKEQAGKLELRRDEAISEIRTQRGAEGIIQFAESVASPEKVGHALGTVVDTSIEQEMLPQFLDTSEDNRNALVRGYIWRRYHVSGWEWCEYIDKSYWTFAQIGKFLACLPFSKETWDRASEWLQQHEAEYWNCANVNPYQADSDLPIAIDKLIQHGRPIAAIVCLNLMRNTEQAINCIQCIRALESALSSREPGHATIGSEIIELISYLQKDPSIDEEDLFRLEWAYLPLLDGHSGAAPVHVERRLARDPKVFCEVIQLIYRSKHEDLASAEPTKEHEAMASNAWQLLHGWKTPPGTREDGTFSEDHFTEWLQRVKQVSSESGHLEVALVSIGEVLAHAPADPSGLWIHRAVATALNDREHDELRNGYRIGTHNFRSTVRVNPTGKTEIKLAAEFRGKADEVENAGFQRLAVTLRELVESYERQAEWISKRHERRDS